VSLLRRVHPLVALVAIAAAPSLVLAGAWQVTSAASDRHQANLADLQLLADDSATERVQAIDLADGGLTTQLLSWRRGAHAVSHQLNFSAFSQEVLDLS
jgi:spermidine synthase